MTCRSVRVHFDAVLIAIFLLYFLNVGKGVSIWQRWHFFVCSLNHWFVPHIHLGFNSFTSTQIHSLNTQSLIRSSVRPSVDRTSLVSVFNVCLSISIYFRKLLLKSLPPDTLFSQGLVRKGSFEILWRIQDQCKHRRVYKGNQRSKDGMKKFLKMYIKLESLRRDNSDFHLSNTIDFLRPL